MTEANYRSPTRADYRTVWLDLRTQVLRMIEEGLHTTQMVDRLNRTTHPNQHTARQVQPGTIRGYFQRIYNELGLPPGRRTPAAALAQAYAQGILPCPCTAHARPVAHQPGDTWLDRINRVRSSRVG